MATNDWFNESYYVAQKVLQANDISYNGKTDWTAESANVELKNFNANGSSATAGTGTATWLDNFRVTNVDFPSNATVKDINVSPNELFNMGEYAQAVANYYNAGHSPVEGATDWSASGVTYYLLNTEHTSLWDHYTNTGAALGLNPSNKFDTSAWADAQGASTGQTSAEILANLAASGRNPLMAYLDGGGTIEDAPAVPAGETVNAPSDYNAWNVTESDLPGAGGDTPGDIVYGETIYLTDKLDDYTGSATENTLFIAQEFDGVNTLQTGDRINGGGGQNELLADVTAGNTFGQMLNAVRPQVENVQKIKFTSQQSTDDHNGNFDAAGIRADRISGANEIWSSDSRATLRVDDVRIDSTKMTVGWQNADNADRAGNHMDYQFHFNNQSLKASDAATSGTLVLQLIDTTGAMEGHPLLDNAYDRFTFLLDGTEVNLDLGSVRGEEAGYDDLLTAFRTALAKAAETNPAVADVTANLGSVFDAYDGNTGTPVQGTQIILNDPNAVLTVPEANAWSASAGLPPTNSLNATVTAEATEDCPLIETKIALDNVGMVNWNNAEVCIPNDQQFGDYAGDLVVGGMGDGHYVGVQRFDVTVDRGSWLKSMQSTNNALRMVTVANADLDDADKKIGTSDADKGNLFIGEGQRLSDNAVAGNSLMFEKRDGLLKNASYLDPDNPWASNPQHIGQTIESGVVDVMNFDASAMTGKANIAAAVTSFASKKYFGDSDQKDYLGNNFAPDSNFNYTFGSNDDTLNMQINGDVAADSDFKMNISMGDGNNSVHTEFAVEGSDASHNWLVNQWHLNNVTIATGSGNDIVNPWGNGRTVVSVGAGDDVVYADNSGIAVEPDPTDSKVANTLPGGHGETIYKVDGGHVEGVGAIYVLNAGAASGANDLAVKVDNGEIVPYNNDILSTVNPNFVNNAVVMQYGSIVNFTVRVSYKGVASTTTHQLRVTPDAFDNTKGSVSITAREVNQLIADTVNDGDLLSSLLSAQEGAGNSLMLISKVDGENASVDNGDLSITFEAKQTGTGATDMSSQLTSALGNVSAWYTAPANVHFAQSADSYYYDDALTHERHYLTADEITNLKLAAPTLQDVKGDNSNAQSDNIINLGADNDLAVLGTGKHSNDTVVINNEDNGFNTIVNFVSDTADTAVDFINTRPVFENGTQLKATTAVGCSAGAVQAGNINETLLTNGSAATATSVEQTGTNIMYVQNAAVGNANHIGSAADLQTQLADADNAQYNITLFMVYSDKGAAAEATFDMYRAVYGASGGPQVTDLGTIRFTDFGNSIADIEGGCKTNIGQYFSLTNADQIGIVGISDAQAPVMADYVANPEVIG